MSQSASLDPGWVHYFAYGSNMLSEEIRKVCPSAEVDAIASVTNRRLAFMRHSVRRGGGVADLLPSAGFEVFGVLYRIRNEELAALDEREGCASGAYRRVTLDVWVDDREEPVRAESYEVITRAPQEIPPGDAYLTLLIRGAAERQLPEHYREFLAHLWSIRASLSFGAALLVAPTSNRVGSPGEAIAQLSPTHLPTGERYLAVSCRGMSAMVLAVPAEGVPDGEIRLDQSVRHALGVRFPEQFGFRADIAPLPGAKGRPLLIQPRTMHARVWSPSWADSEKRLCVLHPSHLAMLGLVAGEYVALTAVTESPQGLKPVRLVLRCFHGSEGSVRRGAGRVPYPQLGEVYLDAECRAALGLRGPGTGVVRVAPAIGKMLRARLLTYAVSFFLALLSAAPVLQEVLGQYAPRVPAAAVAAGCAMLATAVLVVSDLRARLQY